MFEESGWCNWDQSSIRRFTREMEIFFVNYSKDETFTKEISLFDQLSLDAPLPSSLSIVFWMILTIRYTTLSMLGKVEERKTESMQPSDFLDCIHFCTKLVGCFSQVLRSELHQFDSSSHRSRIARHQNRENCSLNSNSSCDFSSDSLDLLLALLCILPECLPAGSIRSVLEKEKSFQNLCYLLIEVSVRMIVLILLSHLFCEGMNLNLCPSSSFPSFSV